MVFGMANCTSDLTKCKCPVSYSVNPADFDLIPGTLAERLIGYPVWTARPSRYSPAWVGASRTVACRSLSDALHRLPA
jgi:hypothetical protein